MADTEEKPTTETTAAAPAKDPNEPAFACYDANNPKGTFGCDKRQEPGCCMKCCCTPCIVINHDGLTLIALLVLIAEFTPLAGFALVFVLCFWQPRKYVGPGAMAFYPEGNVVGAPVGAELDSDYEEYDEENDPLMK